MGLHRDDLDEWATDPVVRALHADGTAQELAGLDPVLAEFRAVVPSSGGARRMAHRLGTGATTVIVAIGLTGGVAAAAYTRTLPGPLQSAMHSLLGPVGVPPAEPSLPRVRRVAARSHTGAVHRPARSAVVPTTPAPTGAAAPASTANNRAHPAASVAAAAPASPAAAPAGPAASAAPAPATSPPAASPSPTPSASATPKPATLTAHPGRVRVLFQQRVGVQGKLLTSAGDPVSDHRVYLQQRPHGTQTWLRVAAGRTRSDGSIVLRTPALARNVDLRLVTPQGLHSAATTVKVAPQVTVTLSKSPNGKRYVVTVKVAGAQSGDTVTLARRSNGDWSRVSTKQLPDSATLTFNVPVPAADAHYRVRVVATQIHTDGFGLFTARAA